MTLIWPRMLVCLLLVPLLVWGYVRLRRQRQTAVEGLGPLGMVQSPSGGSLGWRRHVPPGFFFAGLTFLLFGLSRPELPVSLPHIEGTVILAFDVSNSMLADDLEPSRIEAAKAAARTFVENQPSTIQIGVVAFGNGGLIVQQPTNVQGDVLTAVDRLSPQGGTSLGQGIFTALNAIAGEPIAIDEAALTAGELPEDRPPIDIDDYSSAVIILLTDGENQSAPDPLTVAQLAAEAGVRIYPVGIGSAEGAVLEIDGFNILTQLNEPALRQIASLTNGTYYQAADEAALQDIYRNIDLQMTIKGEKMEITSLLAGLGAFLFLLAGTLSMAWFGRIP
ncbi:MAG: VWA domain-containing protein [Ardenticatenaceae bacterium]|nr:VWA domain-containing protein [Ardenticatenaceae bacterium]